MSDLLFKAKMEENNRLLFYADNYVFKNLIQFKNKDVYVRIKEFKPTRSISQNNWYYGVAIPLIQAYILDTQGEKYTKEEINQYHLNSVVKSKFEQKIIFGKICIIYDIKSTSKMSTNEFCNFKEEIQKYWAERDLIIPDPNSNLKKT